MHAQRRLKLKVKAQDVEGNPMLLSLSDWQARIFQHEYDHLQVRPTPVQGEITVDCALLLWLPKMPGPSHGCKCAAQGKLFHDRMTPAVLQTIRKDLVALEEDFLSRHPGVAIQRVV